ncbi:hypothetical protein [Sphingomonas sp. GB1N7]|uniref:hypothetical protein n=1 Tax=Parasphingomonas caseinilytica TaxID=3096158 RepID=UPI002FC5B0D3
MTFYQDRLDAISETLDYARRLDVSALTSTINTLGDLPVVTIGSGGSLVTAALLADEIVRRNRVSARAMTPLEVITDPLAVHGVCVWLVSAEGSNPDIVAAMEAVVRAEPGRLIVICNKADSLLAQAARDRHLELFVFPTEDQKDGFLATHTLMLSTAAILRASRGGDDAIPLSKLPAAAGALSREGPALFMRETLFVLFDPLLADAARLVETNLWEAAVMNVEAVDLRNFAHGRHLWAAKRGGSLSILVLATDVTASLWAELDRELPPSIPRSIVFFDSADPSLVLSGLWTAMVVTNVAGWVRGIDPGRPGVPDFGRRIYHSPALLGVAGAAPAITPVARKVASRATASADPEAWRDAEAGFRARLSATWFDALVLDYDGTLVWSNARQEPPGSAIVSALRTMLESGIPVAFATGRGDSVGVALRSCLPERLWPKVIVGYYNGGLCMSLDEAVDRAGLPISDGLMAIKSQLNERFAADALTIKDQTVQLCITSDVFPVRSIRELVLEIIAAQSIEGVLVLTSGHSVDVLKAGTDKRNVLDALAAHCGKPSPNILRIGDSGGFPGNDYSLLDSPFGLSVDRVSGDREGCWNLLPAGIRGPDGLVAYLQRLSIKGSGFSIDAMTL